MFEEFSHKVSLRKVEDKVQNHEDISPISVGRNDLAECDISVIGHKTKRAGDDVDQKFKNLANAEESILN